MPDDKQPEGKMGVPEEKSVREQLQRITRSSEFESSKRSADFLEYVVGRVLEGRECEISQHAIAASVFKRGADFDPTADPIVRIQAGRVRRSLKHYYLTEGVADPVVIELPKGTYIPVFRLMDPAINNRGNEEAAEPMQEQSERSPWPCILVRPFRNLTGKDSNAWLSDGLAADLATELSNYPEMCVFLGSEEQREGHVPREAAFELRGAIQRSRNSLRLSAQLLAHPSGQVIWAHNYRFAETLEEGSAPLNELTQEIAALIAEEKGLVSRHLMHDCGRKAPVGSAAYQALLEYYHLDLNFDPVRFVAVLETLEATVETEPDNGACWTALARLYADMLGHEMMADRLKMERGLECARRGVALLPNCTKCHLTLALLLVIDDQMDEAIQEVEIARSINKDSLTFLDAIGYLLILCGDWERGRRLSQVAIRRNPFHRQIVRAGLWLDALHREDWAEALERARSFNLDYSYWGPLMRLVALVLGGNKEGVDADIQQLLEMKPDFPQNSQHLVRLYIKGDNERALISKALKAVGLQA